MYQVPYKKEEMLRRDVRKAGISEGTMRNRIK